MCFASNAEIVQICAMGNMKDTKHAAQRAAHKEGGGVRPHRFRGGGWVVLRAFNYISNFRCKGRALRIVLCTFSQTLLLEGDPLHERGGTTTITRNKFRKFCNPPIFGAFAPPRGKPSVVLQPSVAQSTLRSA